MAHSSLEDRRTGDVIAALGVIVMGAGLLIFLDLWLTNSATGETEASGLLGAAAAMYQGLSIWLEMLLRSTIVTGLALLVIGFTFVYTGVTLKNTQSQLAEPNSRQVNQNPPATISSTLRGLATSLGGTTEGQSDSEDGGRRIVAAGAIIGLFVGFITNASLGGMILWTALAGGIAWITSTPAGNKFVEEKLK